MSRERDEQQAEVGPEYAVFGRFPEERDHDSCRDRAGSTEKYAEQEVAKLQSSQSRSHSKLAPEVVQRKAEARCSIQGKERVEWAVDKVRLLCSSLSTSDDERCEGDHRKSSAE